MVSEVRLEWENKDKTLRGVGSEEYDWFSLEDDRLKTPVRFDVVSQVGNVEELSSNLLIVGDALDAMDGLQQNAATMESVQGGVRVLYIDPPFNTGRAFRQYDDALTRSMWLSMLRDRLVKARTFLANDASVWLHLDDNQIHHARCVLDEVFGPSAFVATVIWQKRTTRESRSAFSTNHDSILVYAPAGPRAWKTSRNLLRKDESLLKNRDNDPRGPWSDAPFTAPGFRANQHYDIVTPSGNVLRPPRGRSWYATESTFRQMLSEDRIWFPKNGEGSPRLKLFSHQLRGLVPFSVWDTSETGTNDDAKRHLLSMFPDKEVFDTPKPEALLERIIHIASNPGDVIMDLFAGSGTTAAVAHKMRRRWFAVERSVSTVADFALPRMISVVNGDDLGGVSSRLKWTGGGGFQVAVAYPRFGEWTDIPLTTVLARQGLETAKDLSGQDLLEAS